MICLTESMFDLKTNVEISYKKIWKLLIGWNMIKRSRGAGSYQFGIHCKLRIDENVDILLRICKTLACDVSDIIEAIKVNR